MLKQFMIVSVVAIAIGTSPALAISTTSSFDVPGTWPTDGAFDDKKASKSDAEVTQGRTTPLTSPVSEAIGPKREDEALSR